VTPAEKRVRELIASGRIPSDAKEVILFPRDSNIRYLPAFFLLPAKLIAVSKDCFYMPRCPAEIMNDPHWIEVIKSDVFLQLVMEGIAYLAWPHIGVYDPKEVFSMDDPLYRWIYGTPLHIRYLDEFGYSLNALFKMKPGEYYAYRSMEEAHMIMGTVMKMVIHEQNMAPIIDCIKKNRCDEDFAPVKSRAKIDFLRKKYHRRNFSDIKEVSLNQMQDSVQKEYQRTNHDIADGSINVEDDALDNAIVDEFKKSLTERDMQILTMRMDGYTHKEIAEKLGYSNHSGVLKRINRIAEAWLDFVDDSKNL